MAKSGSNDLKHILEKFTEDLRKTPESLDDLMQILNTIASLRAATEEVEAKYRDVMECYRTLKMYSVLFSASEYEEAQALLQRFYDLLQVCFTISICSIRFFP